MKQRHPSRPRPARGAVASAALAALAATPALAFEIDTGHPDLKLRWDNTVRYSAMARLDAPSPGLSRTVRGPGGVLIGDNNFNQDDGNNNFRRGLVSSRLDLLSELDATYKSFGLRVSAAAWYDSVYNRSNHNTTTSSNSVPRNEFPVETREIMGREAELLDAFVFARIPVGERTATVRLGRHTLIWGESLFFGVNGIAGGMAPLDLVKLSSVPGSTFKENARPTGKLSASVPLSDNVSVGAYVPYRWEKSRLMPVGAYLSTSDTLGAGGGRIIAGPNIFVREPDRDARDSGQWGMQLRWDVDPLETTFGFYALRYHALTPSNNWLTETAAGRAISYQWVYHEGIEAYGVSASRSFGEWSIGSEVSWRRNSPLASVGQDRVVGTPIGANFTNTRDNPGYALGESLHAQVSWIASLGPSFISEEASFVGEIAWNRRMRVTQNAEMLNANATRAATALRVSYSPTYRQVLPGLDLSPSIGGSYTWGKSSAVGPAFGPDQGGDISLGLRAVYLGDWIATLNYTTYHGPEGPTLDPEPKAQFKQALKDRRFVSFSLSTAF